MSAFIAKQICSAFTKQTLSRTYWSGYGLNISLKHGQAQLSAARSEVFGLPPLSKFSTGSLPDEGKPVSSGQEVIQEVKQNAVDPPSESPGSSTTADSATQDSFFSPRLVVFGGNGYVGSRVCEAALQSGLQVLSISRSGTPAKTSGNWVQEVQWMKGDAFDGSSYRSYLQGALGVVSCIGAFGSNAFMMKVNGEANVTAINEAAEAGVPRFAFISAHQPKVPEAWHLSDFLLRGYFQGKLMAEKALFEKFPEGGVALRPFFIYGNRAVGNINIPLGIVGAPVEMMMKYLPSRSLSDTPLIGAAFVPPVPVEAVGKAAVAAATDPAVQPGILDVWAIQQYK